MKNYSRKDRWNNKIGRKVEKRERGRGETVKNHHRVRCERREHLKEREVRRKRAKLK